MPKTQRANTTANVQPINTIKRACSCSMVTQAAVVGQLEQGVVGSAGHCAHAYQRSCSTSRPSAAATFSSVALRGCLTRSICA